jgi:hypothetical protein
MGAAEPVAAVDGPGLAVAVAVAVGTAVAIGSCAAGVAGVQPAISQHENETNIVEACSMRITELLTSRTGAVESAAFVIRGGIMWA